MAGASARDSRATQEVYRCHLAGSRMLFGGQMRYNYHGYTSFLIMLPDRLMQSEQAAMQKQKTLTYS